MARCDRVRCVGPNWKEHFTNAHLKGLSKWALLWINPYRVKSKSWKRTDWKSKGFKYLSHWNCWAECTTRKNWDGSTIWTSIDKNRRREPHLATFTSDVHKYCVPGWWFTDEGHALENCFTSSKAYFKKTLFKDTEVVTLTNDHKWILHPGLLGTKPLIKILKGIILSFLHS